MHNMLARCVFLIACIAFAKTQTKVGDTCVDQYTSTVGRCKEADACESARIDYQKNGISPTFCTYSAFGTTLVCCRDGGNILHTAETKPTPPTWGSNNNRQSVDKKRVSERKCEEYSRPVVDKVAFIPLVLDPETLIVTSAKCEYTGVKLIIGGEKTILGEFPHMVAIGWTSFDNGYLFSCGGSLISPKFVLTAAHCLKHPIARDPNPVVIRLGDQNIDDNVEDGARPIEIRIKKIHTHPEYESPKKYNDIALFEMESEVAFSASIRPACLWTRPDYGNHSKALATGWGVVNTATSETSKELLKVSLSLLATDYCDELLKSSHNRNWWGFQPTQMCAGELEGGKDTCQGDSGSPLQVTTEDNQCIFFIIGLTSFGKDCGKSGRPAVYTRVSSYVDWIEGVVWPGE